MKFVVYVLLAAVLGLSISVSYQFSQISQSRSQARARQHSYNARFAAVTKSDCLEIEKLKANVRNQAIANKANLKRNAQLLGIKLTPALIHQEQVDTAHTLRVYAKEACPRTKA